ncbi:nuclear speckle splicing regulatory protein 1 [Microplitis mediator]|uniref:nuclear speckle splicing regulatory protein 1 n=1 Tax=Microplitis mediator TaxID=375433 RepID=UPI0025572641|nr:nuclear speckle splicing regulatory protein 1 [Microplitis mediator]XP_057339685.1 nuclear speckle splicing regulatory protein 1 [Microplitis mediator]
MDKSNKQYGLIVPKKAQLSAPKAGNVFGDDDDSDKEDCGVNFVQKALTAEGEKIRVKKQTKLNMQKALDDDPTIYQYDEIYDDMERAKKEKVVNVTKEAKKPKYIHCILKASERRKREQEHRIERMVQKEREAEGEMFADKESFVTSGYRAKLEEFRKMEEEEERMDRLESIGDVTKQQDMSGFYRHLYSQTVDKKDKGEDEEAKDESECQEEAGKAESNIDQDEDLAVDSDSSREYQPMESDSDHEKAVDAKINTKIASASRKRQYRARNIKDSDEESDEDDDDDDKESAQKAEEKDESQAEPPAGKTQNVKIEKTDNGTVEDKKPDVKSENIKTDGLSKDKVAEEEKIIKVKEEKPKVSIWEKRTVGEAYEAAVQRYYARKALRMSS